MVKEQSISKLDQTDLMLISELEVDARQSTYELAKKIGISASTVRTRLQKLEKDNTIRFTTLSDPFALGYKIMAVLGITVVPGQADSIASQMESHDGVVRALVSSGRYDIMAHVFARSSEDMFTFVTGWLGIISGVLAVETMPVLKFVKQSWRLLGTDQSAPPGPSDQRKLDAQDLLLIRELESNPRLTISSLSHKLGVTRQTASARLQRLSDTGLVRVVTIADPLALGYTTRAGMLIKAHPSKIPTVTATLASNQTIQNLLVSTGRYDIIAFAVFRHYEEMADFFGKELGKIPGVQSHESFIYLRSQRIFQTSYLASSSEIDGKSDQQT